MGKILDAVRAKNNGSLTPDQEQFVSNIEIAFQEAVRDEVKGNEKRHSELIDQAISKVVGAFPKNEDGSVSTMSDQVRSLAEKMDRLESNSTRKLSAEEKFNLRKMLEDNKEAISKAVNSNQHSTVDIAFSAMRAAAMMTTQNVINGATVSTGSNIQVDNEIAFIRYPENFVLNIVKNREVSKVPDTITKREQDPREGQAVVVSEGGLKPLVSYSFTDKVTRRKKIAAHMEWTEELEYDYESLFNAIIDLFETDLLRDWQNILLNEIITTAPSYVSTALDGTVPHPNIYSAIGASILSIQNMEHQPNIIWMNPSDVWAMNLTQDTTGQYVIPPIMVGNNQIAGLKLYVSNAIDPGKVLIGDSTTWKEQHSGYITRIGFINEQFIHNEKTIVGEVFSIMQQATADQGSWIYADVATINAALQKV